MYHVEMINRPGNIFDMKSEEADKLCGKNYSPLHALLAALGGCVAIYLRRYIDERKLPVKEFGVTVESELVKEPPMSFRKISVAIDLKGAALDEDKKEVILRFIRNCPVHNTIKGSPEIDFKI